jgi:hypothetical protein
MLTPVRSAKHFLVWAACASSLLPYLILFGWDLFEFTRGYDPMPIAFAGSLTWLALALLSVVASDRKREQAWVFCFAPVAFGPWLVVLYIVLHAWLFGFAP